MRVFVINLDRSAERMRRMAELLRGIPFERIAAVDAGGAVIKPPEASEHSGYPMSRIDVACIMSHARAWKLLVDSGDPWGTVLEDDLHLGGNFHRVVTDGIGFPGEFDVIKLETFNMRIWIDRFDTHRIEGTARIARLHSRHFGAGAYVVSRQGAQRLLAMAQRPGLPIDLLLFGTNWPGAPALRRYQMIPACVIQDMCLEGSPGFEGIASTQEPTRVNAFKTYKRPARNKLHREAKRLLLQALEHACFLTRRRVRVEFER